MKVNTVNVVEYAGYKLLGVHAFENTPEGNKEAEEAFREIVRENGDSISDEEMASFIDEKYFEQGDYQAFLTHSSNV